MRALATCVLSSLLCAACHAREPAPVQPVEASSAVTIDAARMRSYLEDLASDAFAGRFGVGEAAEPTLAYLSQAYADMGIAPLGDDYTLSFIVMGPIARGEDALHLELPGGPRVLERLDYTPLVFSGSAQAEGELVFVGYAGQSPPNASYEREYDALAGVDLRGKIAVALLGTPQDEWLRYQRTELIRHAYQFEAHALLEAGRVDELPALQAAARQQLIELVERDLLGQRLSASAREAIATIEEPKLLELPTNILMPADAELRAVGFELPLVEHSPYAKAARLRDRGAVAVLFVNGPSSFVDEIRREADRLPPVLVKSIRAPLDIPVLQVRSAVAERLLATLELELAQTQAELDAWQGPRSRRLPGRARLSTSLTKLEVPSSNVIAAIPGSDLAEEVVVIGGHWDHIGTVDDGICIPQLRADGTLDTICNGADDNASGTAMTLALAQAIVAAGVKPRRTLAFAHFGAEELGLIGSRALVRDWPAQLGTLHSMINLDMVGRLSSKGYMVWAANSSETWNELLLATGAAERAIICDADSGRSDHVSFLAQGVPSIMFFTMLHGDYHMPGDELETINFAGMETIAADVLQVLLALAEGATLGPPIEAGTGPRDPLCREHMPTQPRSERVEGVWRIPSVQSQWEPAPAR